MTETIAETTPQETASVCAVLTGSQPAAVGVIGCRGPLASQAIQHFFSPNRSSDFSSHQIRYGTWGQKQHPYEDKAPNENKAMADESVVIRLRTWNSSDERIEENTQQKPTESADFEIHGHGGPAALRRIIADLESIGIQTVDGWNYAFPNDPIARETQQFLASCTTGRLAAIATKQVRQGLAEFVRRSRLELAQAPDDLTRIKKIAGESLRWAKQTVRLAEPRTVALIGPPNAGKSSLSNQFVGYERSIIAETAGTTRDLLQSDSVISGIPVKFVDTAGIRESDDLIESEGVRLAAARVATADLVLVVECFDEDGSLREASGYWRELRKSLPKERTISIINKSDLLNTSQAKDLDGFPDEAWLVSAVTGEGIAAMMAHLSERLLPTELETAIGAGLPLILCDRQWSAMKYLIDCNDATEALESLARLEDET